MWQTLKAVLALASTAGGLLTLETSLIWKPSPAWLSTPLHLAIFLWLLGWFPQKMVSLFKVEFSPHCFIVLHFSAGADDSGIITRSFQDCLLLRAQRTPAPWQSLWDAEHTSQSGVTEPRLADSSMPFFLESPSLGLCSCPTTKSNSPCSRDTVTLKRKINRRLRSHFSSVLQQYWDPLKS
jgi:hypothetical protein